MISITSSTTTYNLSFFFFFFFFFFLLLSRANAGLLPDVFVYSFVSQASKTLPSTTSTEQASAYNCSGSISSTDTLGRLAIVTLNSTNQGCWSDGRYNNINYDVQQGALEDTKKTQQFDAYVISESSNKATEGFVASASGIYYKFPTREDYTIYSFDSTAITKVLQIQADAINTAEFIKLSNNGQILTTKDLSGSITLLFVPSSQRVSVHTSLAANVEGSRLASTDVGDLLLYRYDVTGNVYDTRHDYNYGASWWGYRYSDKRQFFLVKKPTGEIGIVWQDESTFALFISWLGANLETVSTISLTNNELEELAAATYDKYGHIYYLTVQGGDGKDADLARSATLYKTDSQGGALISIVQDTSPSGLNMVSFFPTASMHYHNGKLALLLGRTMHASSDGLNHQGGIAVVYDAETLVLERNHGQTSGHSFENFLTASSDGKFLGVDLGDNYPRGINLHKFSDSTINSRVVYTFKTRHGISASSPAGVVYPEYTEISGGGETYYQWSNDNETYTELGGIVEASGALSVVFSGEPDSDWRSLNNSRTNSSLNDARNIGLIQVRPDFENASGSDNQVTDDLVLSVGDSENGGFYGFNGRWHDQRNAGVVWLTNYTDPTNENALRVRAAKSGDGKIIVLWEKWTDESYVSTYAMIVSPSGVVLKGPLDLGIAIRLNRRDDIWSDGTRIYSVAGVSSENKLELFVLELDNPRARRLQRYLRTILSVL